MALSAAKLTYKMKRQNFSISVRAITTSGKSFTAGFEPARFGTGRSIGFGAVAAKRSFGGLPCMIE
jgi:hypothetical protein